ncbi:hypothetical protein ILUMI_10658 [Ignelater luminosus]|uniref:Uncharacterized protein n=1 Tax=Ignelater luminosus TaxID=2038154 RepID=A0A8K0CXH8_IGNLU|nr:hypothetical protein ILUMI_10658 [Ignelater luminosus]
MVLVWSVWDEDEAIIAAHRPNEDATETQIQNKLVQVKILRVRERFVQAVEQEIANSEAGLVELWKAFKQVLLEFAGKYGARVGKIEEDFEQDQKLFYRVLKNMRKESEFHSKQIKYKAAKVLQEERKIMERWREYFMILLVQTDTAPGNVGHSTRTFSEEELDTTLKKMKTGKATGHDHISPKMAKYLRPEWRA